MAIAVSDEDGTYLPTHEQIARRAYLIWEERGRGDGHADDDWIRAEPEVRALDPQTVAYQVRVGSRYAQDRYGQGDGHMH